MRTVGFEFEHTGGSLRREFYAVSPSSPVLDKYAFPKQSHPSGNKISPAILFLIIVLSVVFFVSGLLHLLVRYLIKNNRESSSVSGSNRYPDIPGSDAFQRQLQQLFHLHDSGLDQAVIDALPVFFYKEIVGLNEPFDCAVCLCEFSEKDKLRLLPLCSHAFHVDCIDTWLLSNSTCPLCRGALSTAGVPYENPIFDLGEIREDEEEASTNAVNLPAETEFASSISKRVFSVRLGKFRNSNWEFPAEKVQAESSGGRTLDSRRCFSMGSYRYIVSEMDLQVTLFPGKAGTVGSFKMRLGRMNVHKGNATAATEGGDIDGKKLNSRSKGESFSISKVWQWSKKNKFPYSSDTHINSAINGLSE